MMSAYPLATPAPKTLEHDDAEVARHTDHRAVRDAIIEARQRTVWADRAEENVSRATLAKCRDALFNDGFRCESQGSNKGADGLPAIARRKPYPQKYKDALVFSKPKPKEWASWWDARDDEELEESPGAKTLMHSSSAPTLPGVDRAVRHALIRGQTFQKVPAPVVIDEDPQNVFSEFALEARQRGADVVITGKRLRPSTGELFRYRLLDTPQSPVGRATTGQPTGPGQRHTDANLQPPSSPQESNHSERPANRPKTGPGTNNCARGYARQPQRSASPGSDIDKKPSSREKLKRGVSNNGGVREPAVLLTECPDLVKEEKPRLRAGPIGLWTSASKLTVVRDLFEDYAANPLGNTQEDNFLERYVERQAEIERMLDERSESFSAAGHSLMSNSITTQSTPTIQVFGPKVTKGRRIEV